MRHAPVHYVKRSSEVQETQAIRWLDRVMLVVAVVGPLSDIPQIYRIYSTQDASGVSLLTFTFYLCTALLWLVYALVHHQKPLIVSNLAWITTEIVIIAGVLLYG